MGLGPPVCIECEVIYEYSEGIPHWFCPVCGTSYTNASPHHSLWGLDKKDQKRYHINTENSDELKEQFFKKKFKQYNPKYLKLEK